MWAMTEDIKQENEDMGTGENSNKKMSKARTPGKKRVVKPGKMEEEIKELQQKYDDLNDKYLRLYSEFDNYRKRTQKEKTDLNKYASEDLIIQLLPVLDDFERGVKSLDQSPKNNKDSFIEGIILIYNKLQGILEQHGLEPIEAIGSIFDVDYHDAITNLPAPSASEKGKVLDEVEKGYLLNGKVIRYAKVIVGS